MTVRLPTLLPLAAYTITYNLKNSMKNTKGSSPLRKFAGPVVTTYRITSLTVIFSETLVLKDSSEWLLLCVGYSHITKSCMEKTHMQEKTKPCKKI